MALCSGIQSEPAEHFAILQEEIAVVHQRERRQTKASSRRCLERPAREQFVELIVDVRMTDDFAACVGQEQSLDDPEFFVGIQFQGIRRLVRMPAQESPAALRSGPRLRPHSAWPLASWPVATFPAELSLQVHVRPACNWTQTRVGGRLRGYQLQRCPRIFCPARRSSTSPLVPSALV